MCVCVCVCGAVRSRVGRNTVSGTDEGLRVEQIKSDVAEYDPFKSG